MRDATFIAANMRDADRREVLATANLGSLTEAAALCVLGSHEHAWCAYLNGEPVGCFGVAYGSPMQPHIRSAWAWGTKRFKRVVPAISRFAHRHWPSLLIGQGVNRVEIRSIEGHDIAHKWLGYMGARLECELRNYGTGGETFLLWSLLKEDWNNVLQDPKD